MKMALYCYFKIVYVHPALSGSLPSSLRSTAIKYYSHATDHRLAWCKYKGDFLLRSLWEATCLQRYLGHTVLGEESQCQREVGDWFLKFVGTRKVEQNITSGKGW